jgi:hypothetical protein
VKTMGILDWIFPKDKKQVKRPNKITVKEFVEGNWKANVENGVCDIFSDVDWGTPAPRYEDMLQYRGSLGGGYHWFTRINFGRFPVHLHETSTLKIMYRDKE